MTCDPSIDVRLMPTGYEVQADGGFRLHNAFPAMDTDRGRCASGGQFRANQGLRLQFHLRRIRPWAFEFHQTLDNYSDHRALVQRMTMLDGALDLPQTAWRVMHTELFVTERYFDGFTRMSGGLLAPLGDVRGRLGEAENTPFPGIAFTHPERGTVLMATLTQRRCKPVWQFDNDGLTTRLLMLDHFDGIDAIPLEPGASLKSEIWTMIHSPGNFTNAVDRYFDLLPEYGQFIAGGSPLREEAVWGSWNYNTRPLGHGDITHDYIVANAAALAKLHPKARWVMIDDGYQRGSSTKIRGTYPGADIFHGGDPPEDRARFPQGMAATAAAIRDVGIKPAIWLTPIVNPEGSLALERPDWLVCAAGRTCYTRHVGYLDYSQLDVREYFHHVWHTVFEEWGYAGLKLDFWTAMFEVNGLRFHDQTRTAVEWRNDFLRDLRGFIPTNSGGGFLLTCCTVNSGNPFLGRYADASRIGNDVGDGRWHEVFRAAAYATATSLFSRDHCLLADVDSIGWCDTLSADENRAWATFALMCGSMCEIGGNLTQLSSEARHFLCRALDAFIRHRKSRMDNPTYGFGSFPADHFISMNSLRPHHEAWINWGDISRTIQPRPGDPDGRHAAIDHWTGRPLVDLRYLPPRSAVMVLG